MRHRASSLVVIGFILVAFGVSAPAALADPIVITSGSFGLHTSDPSFFTFTGDGFVFSGGSTSLSNIGEEFPFFHTCCRPGLPVDLSAHIGTGTIRDGFHSTFQGVTYDRLFWSGHLDFEAPSVAWPTDPTFGVLAAPFQMTGQLTAFSDPSFSTRPLFSVDLVGSGTATLGVLPFSTNGIPGDLDFTFSAQEAAAPEPASILLMMLGLGGVALRRRARTR